MAQDLHAKGAQVLRVERHRPQLNAISCPIESNCFTKLISLAGYRAGDTSEVDAST